MMDPIVDQQYVGIPLDPVQATSLPSSGHTVLCCQCGVSMPANQANMCLNCIRNQVDITEGIPKQLTAQWCKNCERWLQPPNSWIVAALESKELMALLLRKIKVSFLMTIVI
jgi:nonsense-mediated mRNA decay protein 3